jgi:peptidoglycan/xylan/chitin deacetylase (PgdA/CDA1 family)
LDDSYENEDGYSYSKDKKTVALTFDDGPNGAKTRQIVDILESNKAHATFFMIGNRMASYASTIKTVLDAGNEIGSHSYDHTNMRKKKIKELLENEEKTQEIYYGITGQYLKYTRPPYGAINSSVKEALDTIFITWSLDTEDWLHRDKDYIVNYVMENVQDGDIILMHDSYNSTVEATRELLPKLYAEGYQVVSVSELANLKGRVLENNTIYRALKNN